MNVTSRPRFKLIKLEMTVESLHTKKYLVWRKDGMILYGIIGSHTLETVFEKKTDLSGEVAAEINEAVNQIRDEA